MLAAEIPRRRVDRMRNCRQWRWHLDEVFLRVNAELHCIFSLYNMEHGLYSRQDFKVDRIAPSAEWRDLSST